MRGGGGNADTGVSRSAAGGSKSSSAGFSSSGGDGCGWARARALRVRDGFEAAGLGGAGVTVLTSAGAGVSDGVATGVPVCGVAGVSVCAVAGVSVCAVAGVSVCGLTGVSVCGVTGAPDGTDWESAVAVRAAARKKSSAIHPALHERRATRGNAVLWLRPLSGPDIVSRFVTVLSGFPNPRLRPNLRTRNAIDSETSEKSSCTRVWQNSMIPRRLGHPASSFPAHLSNSKYAKKLI